MCFGSVQVPDWPTWEYVDYNVNGRTSYCYNSVRKCTIDAASAYHFPTRRIGVAGQNAQGDEGDEGARHQHNASLYGQSVGWRVEDLVV